MKKSNLVLKIGMATILAGNLGTAVAANPGVGTAKATVVAPITVNQAAEMSFGVIGTGATASEMILAAPGGAVTRLSGTAVSVDPIGTAGQFTITGVPNAVVNVDTLGETATLASSATEAFPMTVDNFTSDADLANILLSGAGTATVSFGATLNLNANQPAGAYNTSWNAADTYNVTVNYN